MQPDSDTIARDDAACDRSSGRLNFFLGTNLKSGSHEAVPARVRNLSAGGMMVEFHEVPDLDLVPGDQVVAELRNIGRVNGAVAWIDGRRLGMRFEKPIDPERARRPVGGRNRSQTGTGLVGTAAVPNRFLK